MDHSDWLVLGQDVYSMDYYVTMEMVRFHTCLCPGKFKLNETQKVFKKRN